MQPSVQGEGVPAAKEGGGVSTGEMVILIIASINTILSGVAVFQRHVTLKHVRSNAAQNNEKRGEV